MSYFDAAVAAHGAGDHSAAIKLFRAAIETDDRAAKAHATIATLLAATEKFDAALVHAHQAVEIAPNDPDFLTTLGNTLWLADRFGEAREPLEAAVASGAPHWGVWCNLGLLEYSEGRYAKAVEHFRQALLFDPDNHGTRRNLAMALMANGEWLEGFEQFESRWSALKRSMAWYCGAPLWQGEHLAGKHILVHHEQGIGDTLQFSRWLKILRNTGATVSFACPQSMWGLFPRHINMVDIDCVVPQGWDYHAPLMSLPRITGVMPEHAALGKAFWHRSPRPRLGDLRIGIVWGGSTGTTQAARRRMDVRHFIPLSQVPGVKLYSFQLGHSAPDLAATGMDALVEDWAPRLTDWRATADHMSKMDAVISIDTAPLHLASGLGIPTLGLLAYVRCWRWSARWDANLTLAQQDRPGDWSGVMDKARHWVLSLKAGSEAKAA